MSVTPDVVPYLLLNYSGRMRDAYTIAHESGHAVHSQLASSHSVLTFQPQLVLAETASVFGEMILYDRMMKQEKDARLKKAILLDKISNLYATIGRQAYFVVFESDAHRAVTDGATVSNLCSIYRNNLKEQFGAAVEVSDEFQWEWASIPHMYHTPFYCYAYAFGNLLSLALYERYTEEGKEFVPTYLKVLSYGGSESPAKVLGGVGVDISSARFWQGGFDLIGRMVGELQKL
jgi:oligoendopeptidase F